MEQEIATLDEVSFWELYDHYIQSDFRQEVLNEKISRVIKRHLREVFKLTRGNRGWKVIRAWIALSDRTLFTHEGQLWIRISCGDVVIKEYDWDRDVLVTHSPKVELVCGPLLGGQRSRGLFVPVFEPDIVERAIILRLDEERKRILSYFEGEKEYWNSRK